MIKKYQELTENELLDTHDLTDLREEYRNLLSHHITETTELYKRIPKRGPSIIVIGPDRVGKTTVCGHISRMLGIPVFKCPSEKQIFKEGGAGSLAFDYMLTHLISQTGLRIVSDRGYPCELVYSRVFGRQTDEDLLGRIDRAHANLGTKILYLYSDPDPAEEDDLVPAEKYWDVKKTYDDFCEWTACRVTQFNTAQMIESFGHGWDTSATVAGRCVDLMGGLR